MAARWAAAVVMATLFSAGDSSHIAGRSSNSLGGNSSPKAGQKSSGKASNPMMGPTGSQEPLVSSNPPKQTSTPEALTTVVSNINTPQSLNGDPGVDVDLDDPNGDDPEMMDPPDIDTGAVSAIDTEECWADDDTVYTAKSCMDVDAVACETYCADNYLCDKWCGGGTYTCSDGAGALCAMDKLSRIDEVCNSSTVTPANWTGTHIYTLDHALDDDTSFTGCDDHAYCNFCKGNATCEYVMNEVAPIVIDGYAQLMQIGYGPLALSILANLDKVCIFVKADENSKDDDSASTSGSEATDDIPAIGQVGDDSSSGSDSQLVTVMEVVAGSAFLVLSAFVAFRRRRTFSRPAYEPVSTEPI